jgi:hypothetical protein
VAVDANLKSKSGSMSHRPITFGKASFLESIEIANREASDQWYSKVPNEELNDAIKCLGNEMSKRDFDRPGLFFVECGRCRNRLFCGDIVKAIRRALKKYGQ